LGAGFKNFGTETLSSADVDGYLMRQSAMVFASAAARDSALSGVLENGMIAYLEDVNAYYFYDAGITLPTGGTAGWRVWYSQWGTFTPALNNFDVGNGTALAVWRWEFGALHTRGQFTLGSTSSFSGALTMDIPDTRTGDAYGSYGAGILNDAGTRLYSAACSVAPSDTVIRWTTDGGAVTSTGPFTWTTGDIFTWDIVVNVTVSG
jgi:hypothetical protein